MAASPPIVYVAGTMPGSSEAFVVQEILALRALGARIAPVGMRANPFTTRLAAELGGVHAIAGRGFVRAAARGALVRPGAALRTMRDVARGPFPSLRSRARTGHHVLMGLALAHHARRIGAAYIHAHHAEGTSTVAMVAARVAGLPFGFTAHGSDVLVHPLLLRQKAAAAAVIVTTSDHVRAALERAAPAAAGRVSVVRSGVPLERFHPVERRRDGETLRLLHVGRLVAVKDQATLVRAVAELAARGVDSELRVVGEGTSRPALEALIRALGLGNRVLLVGAVANEELPAHYAWADLFVMSSRSEGLPVVLIEALSTGLPVVATDVGGIGELVRDGQEGFLVAPKDPTALADAIERLRDPTLRARMGGSGAERARGHDLAHAARTLLGLFPVDPPDPEPAAAGACALTAAVTPPRSLGGALPVAVIVRCRDAAARLPALLASVAAQRPRPPGQVIVVDDGSLDATAAVAAAAGATVVRHERPLGPAAAADAGVRAASEPWIALLDDGCDWLPHHLATLWELRRGQALVMGSVLLCGASPERDRVSGPGRASVSLRGASRESLPRVPSSAVIVSRDAVLRAGGFAGRPDDAVWERILRTADGIATTAVVARVTVPDGAPADSRDARGRRLGRWAARRRSAAVARDGGPSVAVLAGSGPERERALRAVGDRTFVDLGGLGRAGALLRLARRPPAMAVVRSEREALLVRVIGVRPVFPDRAEAQTRRSRAPLRPPEPPLGTLAAPEGGAVSPVPAGGDL